MKIRKIDLTGKVFGYVEVLKAAGIDKNHHSLWECRCLLCGKSYIAAGTNLKRKATRSCGCLASESMKKNRCDTTIDLKSQRFGHLTVLRKDSKRDLGGNVYWLCVCDCGNKTSVSSASLRKHLTKTCGGCIGHRKIIFNPGDKIHRFTILEQIFRRGEITKYKCRCDCGMVKIVNQTSLVNQGTKSCGCLHREKTSQRLRILPFKAYEIKNPGIRRAKYLTDGYLRGLIHNTDGVRIKDITPKMVAFKREHVLLFRELKTLKREVQHGIN